MREIIEEYAGTAAGGAAAMAILAMAVQFVLGGSGLYGVILGFSQSIWYRFHSYSLREHIVG